MRALYKNKHDLLLAEIKEFKCVKKIFGERSGVHILLQMDAALPEEEWIERARLAGVKVYPLSEYCIDEKEHKPSVLLGYATLSEEEIGCAVRILKEAWAI